MLQSSRREKCDSFKLDDTLQRKRKRACLSSCIQQGHYHNLSRDAKRGFLMPSNRVRPPNSGATRNKDKPAPREVKRQQGHKEKNVMKSEIWYALTLGVIIGLIILGMRSCHNERATTSSGMTPSFGRERNANCRLCGCDKWKFDKYGSCVYCGHSMAQH